MSWLVPWAHRVLVPWPRGFPTPRVFLSSLRGEPAVGSGVCPLAELSAQKRWQTECAPLVRSPR